VLGSAGLKFEEVEHLEELSCMALVVELIDYSFEDANRPAPAIDVVETVRRTSTKLESFSDEDGEDGLCADDSTPSLSWAMSSGSNETGAESAGGSHLMQA